MSDLVIIRRYHQKQAPSFHTVSIGVNVLNLHRTAGGPIHPRILLLLIHVPIARVKMVNRL